MSGDRPKLISAPTSFSQGVARTDMKTWGVMGILLVIAIAAVMLLGVFHEKQPMFGNAPFGQAPPQQQQQPQSERLREIPVVRPGELPPPPPPPPG